MPLIQVEVVKHHFICFRLPWFKIHWPLTIRAANKDRLETPRITLTIFRRRGAEYAHPIGYIDDLCKTPHARPAHHFTQHYPQSAQPQALLSGVGVPIFPVSHSSVVRFWKVA